MMRMHAAVGVLTFALTVIGVRAQEEENLIPNPSLEEPVGEDGVPKGWYFFKDEAGEFEHAIVEGGHTGNKCYKVSGSGQWAGAAGPHQVFDPASRYVASGWVKVEGEEAKATVKVDYFDEAQKYLGDTLSGFINGPSDWKLVTAVSRENAFPEARFVGVAVMMNGKGVVYADDLSLIMRKPLDSEAVSNLLVNGSAESGAGDRSSSFVAANNEGANPTFEWSTDAPHSGARCLHIKGEQEWAVLAHEHVPFDATKTYTARAWGRVKEGRAVLKVDYFRGENRLGDSYAEPFAGDTWTEASLTVPNDKFPDADRLSVVVALEGNGEAWFDDLVLEAK